jgi:hypothetical protein
MEGEGKRREIEEDKWGRTGDKRGDVWGRNGIQKSVKGRDGIKGKTCKIGPSN